MHALLQSDIPGYPRRQGKVRDVYDLGDKLVIVASDRISAFDWVMPTPIPGKGKLLSELTLFWLETLGEPNHLISADLADFPPAFQRPELEGRSMLVKKTQVVPFECVVRGYLAGSGWKEYKQSGTVCGIVLPKGLVESSELPDPIFTPATKAESGHDENVPYQFMADSVGEELAGVLMERSIALYTRAAMHARERGIIIADTKFEWGILPDGRIILIDEALTPDSSRFWPADKYSPGKGQPSYDKQFLRDWLETTGWDKSSPPPALPDDVVEKTLAKYRQAKEKLTGEPTT